jgi:tape measure domain-containing protein
LSIEESTFKTREEYLEALADATGLSVNTVTKMYEDGVISALKLSE